MVPIRYVLNIYADKKSFVATREVSRSSVPRIGEYFHYLDGWGAATVKSVFNSANSDEVECHVTIGNLQAELESLLTELRATNWTVRE